MSASVRVAVDAGDTLGEGVLWCARRETVYWTDIARARLWEYRPADASVRAHAMPERLGSMALCEDPDLLLLALASRLAFYRLSTGECTPICEIEAGLPTRANDGACDREGRFVFGTLHEPRDGEPRRALGAFYRLDADLRLERLPLPNVAIANSVAFSPDGRTLYFCDSPTRRILRCAYGDTLGAPETFVDLADDIDAAGGVPDGSSVDAEGALWNAQWGLRRVVRYRADGRTDRVLAMPCSQPTRPVFGGADLRTLYVTSAREDLAPETLAAEPQAGALLAVTFAHDPACRGVAEPRFAGSPGQRSGSPPAPSDPSSPTSTET